jgi:hypothetical protein
LPSTKENKTENNQETKEEKQQMKTTTKGGKALLGLAVSALSLQSGEIRRYRDMEKFCRAAGENITWQALWLTCRSAMRKMSRGLGVEVKERNTR